MKKFIAIALLSASILLSSCSDQSAPPAKEPSSPIESTQLSADANVSDKEATETTWSADTEEPTAKETEANVITPVGPKVEMTEGKTAVKGISLEKIDTISPQKDLIFSKGDLVRISGDFICTLDENGVGTMCDSMGNEIPNCTMVSADEPYAGYVVALQEGELIPRSQLMTVSGDIIIPFAEIHIEFLNERFLEIIVPEATTDNAAEAILKTSNSWISLGIQEGDVLFKGYKKVFDLKTGEYVKNIELRSNDSDISACGDTLYVKDDHEYNMILDSDGNVITEGFKFCEIFGEMYSITFDFQNYSLYDSNMNKLFDYPRTLTLSDIDNSKFLLKYLSSDENGNYFRGVLDSSGNVLVEAKLYDIGEYHNGIFIVSMAKGNGEYGYLYGLCDMSGNLIVPCEYEQLTYENGFYKAKKQNNAGYVMMNAEGKIVAESDEYLDYFAVKESKGLFYVLVLNTGDYQMEFEKRPQEQQFAFGLLTAYDETSKSYALFEYVNGTQLTEYAYEAFRYHDGCIYALSGGVYTIYRIQYQY